MLFLILCCWAAALADGPSSGIAPASGLRKLSLAPGCPSLDARPEPDPVDAASEAVEPADEESEEDGSDELGWACPAAAHTDESDPLSDRSARPATSFHPSPMGRCQASRSPPPGLRHD